MCTNISIVDDVSLEGSETFEGRLTTSADRVTLNPDQTSITIVDDDGKSINSVHGNCVVVSTRGG